MNTVLTDHYGTLGVSRDASAAELRKTYFTLIKVHTPENDPERFRLISEAYRTLANPEKRKAYDAEEQIPPGVSERLDSLRELAESDVNASLQGHRALARQYPDLQVVQFALGVLLDRNEEYTEASRVFQALFDANPESAAFATWLGDALIHDNRTQKGEDYLKQAIVLDRHHTQAYYCLARHYAGTDRDQRALETLQRGIDADDQLDLQDISLLVLRIFILARTGPWKTFERETAQITKLPRSDDEEARRYVASELWPLVEFFNKVERPDLTQTVVEAVVKLHPTPELEQIASKNRKYATLYRQRWQLMEDHKVAKWVKALVYAYTDEELDDNERGNIAVSVANDLTGSYDRAQNQWNSAYQRYPAILGHVQDMWNRIRDAIKPAGGYSPSYSNSSSRSSVSSNDEPAGCAVTFVLVLIAIAIMGCI